MFRLSTFYRFTTLFLLFGIVFAATVPDFILHVIVDDLGHGDVGFHRDANEQETPTPHLNELASAGIILDRFYGHYSCTPSRTSFLSGRLPIHAQMTLVNPDDPTSGMPRNMTALPQKLAGKYKSYVVGKWDLGFSTPTHTPEGRGFTGGSLVYAEHKNDFYTQRIAQSACQEIAPETIDLWDSGAPARTLNGSDYEEFMFNQRVTSIIRDHDLDTDGPLFLYYAPHVAHAPMQTPKAWLDRWNSTIVPNDEALCQQQTAYVYPGSDASAYRCRAIYESMVGILDESMYNITQLIREKGWWNRTLIVLHSDNGGPLTLAESGASNHPLRGGKYSAFEGGIRLTALVSGGFLPPSVRGTTLNEIVHIADWYGTYAEAFANVSSYDPIAAAAGLPPVDTLNMWPLLSGANRTSPRVEVPVGPNTLIQGRYKLIAQGTQDFASWSGPRFPNSTSPTHPVEGTILHCPNGCLFDVSGASVNATEHVDLASFLPTVVKLMSARLAELRKGFWSNNDTGVDVCPPNITIPCACYVALPGQRWNGFLGPYQY